MAQWDLERLGEAESYSPYLAGICRTATGDAG
jgi:hypothetical protein